MSRTQNDIDFPLAVRKLFAFEHPDEWFAIVAGAMRDVLPCDSVTWAKLEFGGAMHMADARIDRPHDRDSLLTRFRATYKEHPITPKTIQKDTKGKVHFTHDHKLLPELRGTALYREVFRELEITHQARLTILCVNDCLTGLGVNRTLASRPFSEPERKVLEQFNRWVVHSYRLAEAERRLVAMSPVDGGWLGRATVSGGAFRSLDANGEQLILQCFPEYSPSTRRLPEPLRVWLTRQRHRVLNPQNEELPDEVYVNENETGRLTVRWKLGNDVDLSALLLYYRVSPSDRDLIRRLKERSGVALKRSLTDRQAATLFWMTKCESNKGIAAALGTRSSTVDKHCVDMYARMESLLPDVECREKRAHAIRIATQWLGDDTASES